MPNDIRQQISMLVNLQDVEQKIHRTQLDLSQVEVRTAELDAMLNEFICAVESGQADVQELTKRIRALESDLQMNQGRIAKSQEKLRNASAVDSTSRGNTGSRICQALTPAQRPEIAAAATRYPPFGRPRHCVSSRSVKTTNRSAARP